MYLDSQLLFDHHARPLFAPSLRVLEIGPDWVPSTFWRRVPDTIRQETAGIYESARVTRSGGLIITVNPTSWPYHEALIDRWRAYPEGMKALCDAASLVVETICSGSLEQPGRHRAIPGRSVDSQPHLTPLGFQVLGLFDFLVEKAFGTITIARKPVCA